MPPRGCVSPDGSPPLFKSGDRAWGHDFVCHWGSCGAGYINVDMALTLSRLPHGYELGLRADSTIAAGNISIGAATRYVRDGAVGTCMVTALSNALRQIYFATVFGS